MPTILTVAAQIQCPHGGQAILETSNTTLLVAGDAALLESDLHTIVGCTFAPGGDYSPCVEIEWSGGAELLQVGDVGVLLEDSVGMCNNAEGAPQGVALIQGAASEVDSI